MKMKMFSVSFSAYGGLCIEAKSADEAMDIANKMLEEGKIEDFLTNIAENPQTLDVLTAEEAD